MEPPETVEPQVGQATPEIRGQLETLARAVAAGAGAVVEATSSSVPPQHESLGAALQDPATREPREVTSQAEVMVGLEARAETHLLAAIPFYRGALQGTPEMQGRQGPQVQLGLSETPEVLETPELQVQMGTPAPWVPLEQEPRQETPAGLEARPRQPTQMRPL